MTTNQATTGIEVVVDRRSKGGKIVSGEERNSNSGLGFMLCNLAMGFDVYDARARHGGGRRRYRRCFQIKRPFHGGPRHGFTALSIREHPRDCRERKTDRRGDVVISKRPKLWMKLWLSAFPTSLFRYKDIAESCTARAKQA